MISEHYAVEIALGIVVTLLMTLLGVLLHHIATCSAVHDRVSRLEEWREHMDSEREERREDERHHRSRNRWPHGDTDEG